jgi:hypothetical protein
MIVTGRLQEGITGPFLLIGVACRRFLGTWRPAFSTPGEMRVFLNESQRFRTLRVTWRARRLVGRPLPLGTLVAPCEGVRGARGALALVAPPGALVGGAWGALVAPLRGLTMPPLSARLASSRLA